ncbi:MAG TPA: efflux RND transporter periplasmic adaptor subunit [Bryobacteraceae bacterium]|nr:efflux RND transporter periplasmic adaptor subunit [Bryobacteraceae bacterium]
MATVSITGPAKNLSPGPSFTPSPLDSPVPSRPKPRARRLLLAACGLAMLIAAGVVYSRRSPAPVYTTARVDRGDIDSSVTTTGNLNAVITVQVGSQVSGNIIALYADFNTKVKKGQLVAEIDPAPFKAAVEQASATLNSAKAAVVTAQASVSQAQADLASAEATVASQKANLVKLESAVNLARVENDRRQKMVKSGSTSQEDADTAQAALEQAIASVDAGQAEIHSAESAAEAARKAVEVARNQVDQASAVVAQDTAILSQAELNLSHTQIVAPVDGTVESRNMDVGQTVAASFQAPVIFLIAQDLTKMQVDTNVDEADVGPIRPDQPATFMVDAYPGQIFHGKIAQIRKAPINVQNVITYDVVIEVANPDLKLFPGMTANASIFTGHVSNALRVPKAALRFHPRSAAVSGGGGRTDSPAGEPFASTVYVLDQRRQLQAIELKTGISDANRVEVASGELKEGQEVVIGMTNASGTPAAPPQGNVSTKKLGF